MGTSYNTQTLPVLSKINKEKNYNYKASLSPWGNKKPLLTNCSLDIHILYMIISFFREANVICLPDTGFQYLLSLFTSGRRLQVLGPKSISGLRSKRLPSVLSACPTQARACAACSASPPAIVSITSHRLPFSLLHPQGAQSLLVQ